MSRVLGTLSSGRRVRLLSFTPATVHEPAGFEIGLRLDTDGQWVLGWVAEEDVEVIEVG